MGSHVAATIQHHLLDGPDGERPPQPQHPREREEHRARFIGMEQEAKQDAMQRYVADCSDEEGKCQRRHTGSDPPLHVRSWCIARQVSKRDPRLHALAQRGIRRNKQGCTRRCLQHRIGHDVIGLVDRMPIVHQCWDQSRRIDREIRRRKRLIATRLDQIDWLVNERNTELGHHKSRLARTVRKRIAVELEWRLMRQ